MPDPVEYVPAIHLLHMVELEAPVTIKGGADDLKAACSQWTDIYTVSAISWVHSNSLSGYESNMNRIAALSNRSEQRESQDICSRNY